MAPLDSKHNAASESWTVQLITSCALSTQTPPSVLPCHVSQARSMSSRINLPGAGMPLLQLMRALHYSKFPRGFSSKSQSYRSNNLQINLCISWSLPGLLQSCYHRVVGTRNILWISMLVGGLGCTSRGRWAECSPLPLWPFLGF